MKSIFIKEISSFFSSVVGYVSILVFLVACGLFLWILPESSILSYGFASMERFFDMAPWLLLLLIPAVTMRSFADEFRAGTIEWLMTKPLRDTDIILGKYLATLALVLVALVPTLLYVYTIDTLSVIEHNIDTGAIIGSYVGLALLSAAFCSVGMFCSSLTSNQIVSFLLSLFACFILYSGFDSFSRIPAFEGGIDYYLGMIGMSFHYRSVSRGILESRDIIYFLSVIFLFLALTRLSLQRRTWDAQTSE